MGEQNKSELKVIFLTVFLYLVGFGVIIPLLPILSRDLGATSLQLGLLMSVYSLNQFLFSPFWGKLSDRVGRRPVLLGCLGLEVLCYIYFAFARSIESLIIARALAGFFGASLSTASAAISDVTSTSERSKGMALIGAAFGLGFICGPALGGGLSVWGASISDEPFFATTFTLLGVSILCLINFVSAYYFLRETNHNLAIVKVRKAGEKKPSLLHQGGLALLEKFESMVGALRRPVVGQLVLAFLLASVAMSSMESTLAFFVADHFNWGLKEVSFGFVYIGVLSTFNQGYLVRKLLPRWGEQRLMVIGLILMFVSLSLIGFSYNLWLLGIAMTILPFGHSMVNPSLLGSISLLSPKDEQGHILGVTQGFAALGRIVGPLIGGWSYAAISNSAPYFASGALMLVAIVTVFALGSRVPSAAKTVSV